MHVEDALMQSLTTSSFCILYFCIQLENSVIYTKKVTAVGGGGGGGGGGGQSIQKCSKMWNGIPLQIRQSPSVGVFKKVLKSLICLNIYM